MQCRLVRAGDCSVLWQLREANSQTPDSVFDNWRNVSDTDTSCCSRLPQWRGVQCDDNHRVTSVSVDCRSLPIGRRLSSVPGFITLLTQLKGLSLFGSRVTTLVYLPTLADLEIVDAPMQSLPHWLSASTIWHLSLESLPIHNISLVHDTTDNARCRKLPERSHSGLLFCQIS